jgi:phenylpyruvate tautomerase PptA (4-oxalocrotonate tautomerase family)
MRMQMPGPSRRDAVARRDRGTASPAATAASSPPSAIRRNARSRSAASTTPDFRARLPMSARCLGVRSAGTGVLRGYAGAMPFAKIEVRRHRPPEEVQALIEAVYQAQRDALKVPEGDRQIRYIEHKPEHFAVPPGKSEDYTFVEILLFPGRSLAAKRALYSGIVRRFGELGIGPADVFIVLHEPPLENWGIRGGMPASEVALGFEIKV